MSDYASLPIAAVSTPPGKGGVAVIRISGEGARQTAERVFFPKNKKALGEHPPRTQVYGDIVGKDGRVDDGMATYFAAPRSFTGEDTVEICCHGGVLVTAAVLDAVLCAGARMAEAGEFTRRAFLSGKLSLTEAEAIGDLLEAKSMSQVRLAAGAGRDRLTAAIEELRAETLELLSALFARIDYPDEDLGPLPREQILARLSSIREKAAALLATYRTGRAIGAGIRTVIVGKPNVGKSTLYNALLGADAAIVTDIPGTTRDLLTETISLGEMTLRVSDTAGVRGKTDDPIEAIGMERTRAALGEAELVLALFDASRPTDGADEDILALLSGRKDEAIALFTKSDLPRDPAFDGARVEAALGRAIEIRAGEDPAAARAALEQALRPRYIDGTIRVGEDAIISSVRQHAALSRAVDGLAAAEEAFASGVAEDAAASELEAAVGALSELGGKAVSDEIVAGIFSKFCVGK